MTQIVCECNEEEEDFPGGPGDTNPPARAGDGDSISGLGRFRMPRSKQAPEPQLPSPWAATIKARAPEACAPTERPPQGSPHTVMRKSPARRNLRKLKHSNEDSAQPRRKTNK